MVILSFFTTQMLVFGFVAASGISGKRVSKRGVAVYGGDEIGFGSVFPGFSFPSALGGPWASRDRGLIGGPSPNEVASIIASAKQASANVMIAQQQVQAAKDNVLSQQKIAMDKETTAALLTQKSEAAAAIQRSEAAAAAQAVILAQQRLAQAKANAAHQQKIAAAKESQAASALQNSARAAALEIQKTEHEASKYANVHRTGQGNAAFVLSATKDAVFSPLTAGTNHVPSLHTLAWPSNGPSGNSGISGWAPSSGSGLSAHGFGW